MAEDTPESDVRDESAETSEGRLAGLIALAKGFPAWASANRLKAVIVGCACLVSMGAVVGTWLVLASGKNEEEVTLDMALEALDFGDYVKACELAKQLRGSDTIPRAAMGGPMFVLGAAVSYEADGSLTMDENDYYLLSVRYLEEARDLGFPEDRRAEGLLLLGKNLYQTGQIPASRPVLLDAIKFNPQRQSFIRWLLAEAYLNDANPMCEEALEHNTLYLADKTLFRSDRQQGLLQRAQIQFRQGKMEACLKTLEEIPAGAALLSDALVVRGRIILSEARRLRAGLDAKAGAPSKNGLEAEIEKKYRQAMTTFRAAQSRDTLSTQASRKAMYLIGICLKELGDFPKASDEFERVGRVYADTPEAMAADFELAEMSRELEQDEEALAAYGRTLGSILDARNYSNPWITLDELRNRTLTACRYYLEAGKFEEALELTRSLHPTFPLLEATRLKAEVYGNWGRAQVEEATSLSSQDGRFIAAEGREKFRLAGRTYEKLASLRKASRQYPDDLWLAAESYMRGHGYGAAVHTLHEYLQNESRKHHARALLYLGEAQLNLDDSEAALTAFEECIEFHPKDATAYQARMLAGTAHSEKGEFKEAEALLQDNLNGALTPSSQEWRDSLFALGLLQYRQKRYKEAVSNLEQVIKREKDTAHAIDARYLIGKCYQHRGEEAEKKLTGDLIEVRRSAGRRQVDDHFNSAFTQYREAQRILDRRQESGELTDLERKTLRNCYFAIGTIQFELGNYQQSIKAYTTITSRYPNLAESLDAYVQIARAHRELNDPKRAKGTLEQARVVVKRLQATGALDGTNHRDEQEWLKYIDWLDTL
jgi:tetratricopeptide (TPR) repeat protein